MGGNEFDLFDLIWTTNWTNLFCGARMWAVTSQLKQLRAIRRIRFPKTIR